MKITNIICIVEAITIVILAIILWHNTKQVETIEIPIEIRDTITVEKERIVEHTKVKYVTKFDTVCKIIYGVDTIKSVIELPIEHNIYQDTILTDSTKVEMAIKYSGFKASLDSVGINYHYIGERAVEVKKRGFGQGFGVSINAGYGLSYQNGQISPSYYVGIGVSYSIGYYKIR